MRSIFEVLIEQDAPRNATEEMRSIYEVLIEQNAPRNATEEMRSIFEVLIEQNALKPMLSAGLEYFQKMKGKKRYADYLM